MTKKAMAVAATLGLAISMAGGAHAAVNLVQNGGFESLTNGAGQMGFNTDATGWSTTGYNFVFQAGTADNPGADGFYGNLKLWGPGSSSANGLPAASPTGGNFVGADGAYQTEPITQTITGLTAGHLYAVSFDWAAAQQAGYDGATTDMWNVSLGGDTQSTHIDSIPTHGFSGWEHQTFIYKATSSTEVLSFLAHGTPTGVPPFALLDGVTLSAVPEPSSLAAMFAGVLGLGVIVRRRRSKKSAA
jgi:hypothetical protein